MDAAGNKSLKKHCAGLVKDKRKEERELAKLRKRIKTAQFSIGIKSSEETFAEQEIRRAELRIAEISEEMKECEREAINGWD